MDNKLKTRGFTLVELSIVIVIISFLVSAITIADTMIQQARLRAIITDLQSYKASYNAFVTAYQGAPGDITTASSYWSNNECGATNTDCDGNGNGVIEAGTTVGPPNGDEIRPALRELALAGMISGTTAQVPDTIILLTAGLNAPAGRVRDTGYFLASGSPNINGTVGSFTLFSSNINVVFYGKTLNQSDLTFVGAPSTSPENMLKGALSPADAFSIDSKIDDGSFDNNGNFLGGTSGELRAMRGFSPVMGCTNAKDSYIISDYVTECVIGLELN